MLPSYIKNILINYIGAHIYNMNMTNIRGEIIEELMRRAL